MQVICLQEEAFYELIDKVTAYIDDKRGDTPDKWVDGMEAMRLLSIKSTTTLQKLRDEGRIRYTQPQPRIILYDRGSIDDYLESHVRETF
jgi:hypothetical protein